jgi:protein-disulfide isomerase
MKSVVALVVNLATAAACIVLVMAFGPQLKERWFDRHSPSLARAEPLERVAFRVALPKRNSLGNQLAKVAFIEFSDFQCPYCGRFARGTLVNLQKEFVDSGKMVYVYRNYPLDRIHPFASQAGKAALCAGDQQKFWPMHDRLFADQGALGDVDLIRQAKGLGLDLDRFSSCFNGDSKSRLADDIADGERAGVTSTPTFLIGTVQSSGDVLVKTRIHGDQPFAVFRAAVEELVRASVTTS